MSRPDRRFSSGFWGGVFTANGKWRLYFASDQLSFGQEAFAYADITGFTVQPGAIWDTLVIHVGSGVHRQLDLTAEDRQAIAEEIRARVNDQLLAQVSQYASAFDRVRRAAEELFKQDLYIRRSALMRLAQEPQLKLALKAFEHPLFERERFEAAGDVKIDRFMGILDEVDAQRRRRNAVLVAHEIKVHQRFFAEVEKTPLTPEQCRAAVVFDDRNLLVAAAGSGKTSTVVAKIGYALQRGYVQPHQILALAFGRGAASELKERVHSRLAGFLKGQQVPVMTFHSLGRALVAQARGKMPTIASDAAEGDRQSARALKDLLEQRLARDARLAQAWRTFQVLHLPAPPPKEAVESSQAWQAHVMGTASDIVGGRPVYRTLDGKMVKSKGELMIANWLFMQGVPYAYEPYYVHDTASATHRQYQPDFLLTEVDVYLEHFALLGDGRSVFGRDYLEGVRWKRALHQRLGTRLVETTYAHYLEGSLIGRLESLMHEVGQRLRPLSAKAIDDCISEQLRQESDRFFKSTLMPFLKHMKSNRMRPELDRWIGERSGQTRESLFFQIAAAVYDAYEAQLQQSGEQDFEDLILQGADALLEGRVQHPYKLILVDEFQDISQSRARLIEAMLQQDEDAMLFAVGDDWQSVYRFAGSDLAIFKNFNRHFGHAEILFLTRTFRANQGITDAATGFIMKGGGVYDKQVTAQDPSRQSVVQIVGYQRREDVVEKVLQTLDQFGHEANVAGQTRSVLILGRYNLQLTDLQRHGVSSRRPHLTIEFKTVHGAKGQEADYVIVVGLLTDRAYGFPSQITDDPLLAFVMPESDEPGGYEERRLFYVALTRARHRVVLVAREFRGSTFCDELRQNDDLREVVRFVPADPQRFALGTCPQCRLGGLLQRNGRYGGFLGCSRYPACDFTKDCS